MRVFILKEDKFISVCLAFCLFPYNLSRNQAKLINFTADLKILTRQFLATQSEVPIRGMFDLN